jgi:16S rRNA (cytosine1402-N4)-methyltransferase
MLHVTRHTKESSLFTTCNVQQATCNVAYHVPVLPEVVRAWAEGSHRAVDGTAGGGGHAAILRAAGARVLLVDRDPQALAAARARLGDDGFHYLLAPFASLPALSAARTFRPDHILLDLGVSSHQLDSLDRGFSFQPGAPLDMRMTPATGPTAADVLNAWPEQRLAQSFSEYGDERRARSLARAVVRRRRRAPFQVSDDFVNAIRETLGPRAGPGEFARLFQTLRIAVNDELGQLEHGLPGLRDALVPPGRIGVITYHSGEARIVRHAFREWGRACVCPPPQPVCTCRGRPLGRVLTRKAITPGAAEVRVNPRARSAQFRAFETVEEETRGA